MTATIYRDMPAAEYHAMSELSRSDIVTIYNEGLRAYRHAKKYTQEPSEAMEFGTLFHSLVLTPDAAKIEFWPDGKVRRGKEWDEFSAKCAASGAMAVREKDYRAADAMRRAVMEHPIAGPLMRLPGHSEVVAVWDDPVLGCPCRAMYDRVPDDERQPIIDLKTVASLPKSADDWWKTVRDYGYDVQDAHYVTGAYALGLRDAGSTHRKMVFVLVAKDGPQDDRVAVLALDSPWIIRGQRIRVAAANALTDAQLSGEWPRRIEGLQTVKYPAFLDLE